jgi:hypothetical protein
VSLEKGTHRLNVTATSTTPSFIVLEAVVAGYDWEAEAEMVKEQWEEGGTPPPHPEYSPPIFSKLPLEKQVERMTGQERYLVVGAKPANLHRGYFRGVRLTTAQDLAMLRSSLGTLQGVRVLNESESNALLP